LTVLLEYFDFSASKVRPKYNFDLNQFLEKISYSSCSFYVFFPYMYKNATKPVLQLLEAFYLAHAVKFWRGVLQHPKHPLKICPCGPFVEMVKTL